MACVKLSWILQLLTAQVDINMPNCVISRLICENETIFGGFMGAFAVKGVEPPFGSKTQKFSTSLTVQLFLEILKRLCEPTVRKNLPHCPGSKVEGRMWYTPAGIFLNIITDIPLRNFPELVFVNFWSGYGVYSWIKLYILLSSISECLNLKNNCQRLFFYIQ